MPMTARKKAVRPVMSRSRKVLVETRVDVEVYERLTNRAEKMDVTMSEVLRIALSAYVAVPHEIGRPKPEVPRHAPEPIVGVPSRVTVEAPSRVTGDDAMPKPADVVGALSRVTVDAVKSKQGVVAESRAQQQSQIPLKLGSATRCICSTPELDGAVCRICRRIR